MYCCLQCLQLSNRGWTSLQGVLALRAAAGVAALVMMVAVKQP